MYHLSVHLWVNLTWNTSKNVDVVVTHAVAWSSVPTMRMWNFTYGGCGQHGIGRYCYDQYPVWRVLCGRRNFPVKTTVTTLRARSCAYSCMAASCYSWTKSTALAINYRRVTWSHRSIWTARNVPTRRNPWCACYQAAKIIGWNNLNRRNDGVTSLLPPVHWQGAVRLNSP